MMLAACLLLYALGGGWFWLVLAVPFAFMLFLVVVGVVLDVVNGAIRDSLRAIGRELERGRNDARNL